MGYMCYGVSVQPLKVMLKNSETLLFFFLAYTFHTFGKHRGGTWEFIFTVDSLVTIGK